MTSTLAAFLSVSFMEACRIALPKVELRFITGHSLLIASRIEARTLDFGIVFEDEHAPIPGFLRQPLLRQRLFLVGRKRRQNRPAPVSLADLAQLPLVLPCNRGRSIRASANSASSSKPERTAKTRPCCWLACSRTT
jgi:LysR family transcriptional regulator, nitrogen assimilation regulatory protein